MPIQPNLTHTCRHPRISKIVGPLRALAQRDDVYKQVSGAVLVELYHPLPWLLADFPNVNYYGAQPADETMDFAFLVVDAHRVPEVEAALNEEYVKQQALIIEGAKPSTCSSAATFLMPSAGISQVHDKLAGANALPLQSSWFTAVRPRRKKATNIREAESRLSYRLSLLAYEPSLFPPSRIAGK